MRFAFVLKNLNGGGAEKAILKTILLLSDAGHQCTLFLFESQSAHQLDSAISVCSLSKKEVIGRGWLAKRMLAYILKRRLEEFGPDITISTLPFADEVTVLSNAKNHWCRIANTLSVEIESLSKISRFKALRRVSRYRKIYGNCNLIAVSEGVARDLAINLEISSRIEIISNPFDRADIAQKASESDLVTVKKPYILYVGRFSPQKRIDLLLDSFLKVQSNCLLVMLTTPNPELLKMIQSRQLIDRVLVMGFQNNPYAWMANAELLVLTSDREGMPNVIIESLLCGTPVVATDCPSGPREILSHISPQSLVPCGDSVALAEAIKFQLSHREKEINIDLSKYDKTNTLKAYERLITRLEN